MNLNAAISNGVGAIPSGYGVAVSIYPHSF